jgi:amino acid transporter
MRLPALLQSNPFSRRRKPQRLGVITLVAATYFMVSGGPYGIEDILGGAGYRGALMLLVLLPFIWTLPTTLMIGELASALPEEGGFYVWVQRAMGPFWGFLEAWLSLAASVFDMAIYPTLFTAYLSRLSPALTAGWHALAWEAAAGTCLARLLWVAAPWVCSPFFSCPLRCCVSTPCCMACTTPLRPVCGQKSRPAA